MDKNHITRVYVLPEFQNEGLGRILMDYLECEAIKDYGEVWLDSSKTLTDVLCKEMDLKNITYHRSVHWTTDAGYVNLIGEQNIT